MRKKLRQPLHLGQILPKTLRNWSVDKKMMLWSLHEKWPSLVGKALGRQTRPLNLRGGTLRIAVLSPAWANELQLLEADLLKKIQLELPEVRQIRFQIETRSSGRIG